MSVPMNFINQKISTNIRSEVLELMGMEAEAESLDAEWSGEGTDLDA